MTEKKTVRENKSHSWGEYLQITSLTNDLDKELSKFNTPYITRLPFGKTLSHFHYFYILTHNLLEVLGFFQESPQSIFSFNLLPSLNVNVTGVRCFYVYSPLLGAKICIICLFLHKNLTQNLVA